MLETLDYTIRIGSTPTFLYFDLYFYSAYAGRYVYFYQILLVTIYALEIKKKHRLTKQGCSKVTLFEGPGLSPHSLV